MAQREPRGASPLNATALENERQGSVEWEITSPALAREIEGYASRTSINRGDAIDLFVSTVDPSYTIDVFRMGWYGGAGAPQVAGPISRPGIRQPTTPRDGRTGLVECRWRDPYRLATRNRSVRALDTAGLQLMPMPQVSGTFGRGRLPATGLRRLWRAAGSLEAGGVL